MLRTELASKLETIAPALLADAIVPAMAQVWFTGERAMTYNDTIALSVPLETDFRGAVPGDTLIKVLKKSLAKEVMITAGKDAIEVKAARTRLKLSLSDPSSFIFTMPKTEKYWRLDNDEGRNFLQTLDYLMLSVGDDPLQPDQCGVTIVQDGMDALLFTTNRSTIAHAKLSLRLLKDGTRVILPSEFCRQMVKMNALAEAMGLYIGEEHACFYAGKVELWGRLLTSKAPLDFVAVTRQFLPKQLELVPVPGNLDRVVERILIVSDDKEASMQMRVEDSRCWFELASSRGEIFDSLPLPGHPDVRALLKPKWIKPVRDFTEMVLTERCLIMRRDEAIYMVSTREAKG
jgi:DNA polymerase III sliding clamp (beta) subunit (PCNA family)